MLDTLREPLEEHSITISRAGGAATYPARFVLVAAMNPCPCGFWGGADRECTCLPEQIERYRGRLSGPVLDRIDLRVHVPRGMALQFRFFDPSDVDAVFAQAAAIAATWRITTTP